MGGDAYSETEQPQTLTTETAEPKVAPETPVAETHSEPTVAGD